MTFTIPPFWCGVIATIAGEFIALVAYAVVKIIKKKRNSTLRRK
jgi:hypothetical protein